MERIERNDDVANHDSIVPTTRLKRQTTTLIQGTGSNYKTLTHRF